MFPIALAVVVPLTPSRQSECGYPHGAGLGHPFFGAVLVALVLRCGFVPAALLGWRGFGPFAGVVAPLGRLMWSGQVFRAAPVTVRVSHYAGELGQPAVSQS